MIAPDSKMAKSSSCVSTMAGMRWFEVMARNSGLNWSPAPMSTGTTS